MVDKKAQMDSFMSDVSIIVRLMRLDAERSMSHRDLGFPEQMVLMVLSTGDPMTQNAVAAKLDIDKGAIARTIAKLEAKGYITRCVNPADRRENFVQITDQCAPIINEMRENLVAFKNKAFDGFSAEERESIEEGIHRLVINISK